MDLAEFLKENGQLFSEELGIDVAKQPFKWFLAAMLFGGRISVSVAKRTYKAYEAANLTTPDRIASASRATLISLHGKGGYTRYDNVTADQMKSTAGRLVKEYDGNMRQLDAASDSPAALEAALREFRGVGPITAKIFLRELRGVWRNAEPDLTEVEILAARDLGFITGKGRPIDELKEFWEKNKAAGYDFRHLESALVRRGLELRRRASRRSLQPTDARNPKV
jgi:hypothetical protein